jgi:hypothetical protein
MHARGRFIGHRAETGDHLPEPPGDFHKISQLDFMLSRSAKNALLPPFLLFRTNRMNRILAVSLSAFTLMSCSTPNSDVSTFYRPNIAVAVGPKTTTPASFILTAPGTVPSTAQAYETNGYHLLGESDFQNLTTAPLRNEALAYAQQIGATLVIYSVEPIGQVVQPVTKTFLDQPGHYITTNTTTKVKGNSNPGSGSSDLPEGMNSEMKQFERENGISSGSDSSAGDTTTKTTTGTTFVPAKYHSEVVPQTFTRTQHHIAFLVK